MSDQGRNVEQNWAGDVGSAVDYSQVFIKVTVMPVAVTPFGSYG